MASKKSQKQLLTIAEVIDDLRNTTRSGAGRVVRVFVEGPDDVVILREIALIDGLPTPTIEECGGRNSVIKLFKAIVAERLLDKKLPAVLFFADKDTYVFSEVPPEYKEIHFTQGFSIENDLFQDGEAHLMAGFTVEEKMRFYSLIQSVSYWFAYEIERMGEYDIRLRDEQTIERNAATLSANFLNKRGATGIVTPLGEQIKANFQQLLRGHFLPQILGAIYNDRDKERPKSIKNDTDFIGICITEGMRPKNTHSHCRNIAAIMRAAMQKA